MTLRVNPTDDEAFWMVWSPEGNAPTAKHNSSHSAINEAERLARKCPSKRFYVLVATDMRTTDSMQRVRLVDELPF